jgi:hypothetical protein
MKPSGPTLFIKYILLSNGVIDLLAALALFFPTLNLPLPGYPASTNQLAFIAGGWGIAALTFGIGRIWTSQKPEFFRVMTILGLIEGGSLSVFCLINISFLEITWLQASLPLAIGSIFGSLYFVSLLKMKYDLIRKLDGANMDIDLVSPQGQITWEQDPCPWNSAENDSTHKCAEKDISICPYFWGIEYDDFVLCCYPHQNPLRKRKQMG